MTPLGTSLATSGEVMGCRHFGLSEPIETAGHAGERLVSGACAQVFPGGSRSR